MFTAVLTPRIKDGSYDVSCNVTRGANDKITIGMLKRLDAQRERATFLTLEQQQAIALIRDLAASLIDDA